MYHPSTPPRRVHVRAPGPGRGRTGVRGPLRRIGASLIRLARAEDGGAYTLSYVMVVPVVMLIVALIVESVLMMSAKIGTVYAGYAAARAASVWSSAADWSEAQNAIERAGRQAMIPFASGSRRGGSGGDPAAWSDSYTAAHRAWATDAVADGYVQAKISDAVQGLSVEVERPPAWDADISVEVTYQFPFRVPGIGMLLGERSERGGYVFPLRTRVTLQNDGPQNPQQDLGIGYGHIR